MALLAALSFGVSTPLTRLAFEAGIPILETIAIRTVFLTVFFAIILIATGQVSFPPRDAIGTFILQLISTALISFGYITSVQFISIGQAVIIFFTFPVVILLISPMIEGHRVSLRRIIISLLAFVGLIIAIGPQFGQVNLFGIALASLSVIGGTLQYFTGRSLRDHMQPMAIIYWVNLFIVPMSFAAAVWVRAAEPVIFTTSIGWVNWLILLSVSLTYVAGYFFLMSALSFAPASIVAPYSNTEPLVAILAAFVLIGQTMQVNQYIGGALVLAALMLGTLTGRKPA